MRNKILSKTLLLALGLGCTLSVSARERQDKDANNGRPSGGSGNKIAANCLTSSSTSSLDINNVRAMVLNGGDMWWNLNDPRYEVPKVNDPNLPKRHSIFAGAVWIGGKDPQNNLYLAAQTYRQGAPADAGYWPGPLDPQSGEIQKDECARWNYHAKIDKTIVDQFRDNFENGVYNQASPSDLPQEIREWPGRNNPHITSGANMNHQLAPFVNVGGSVDAYEPLLGDYPNIQGDQAIWWVMNDAGNVKEPLSNKIGLELQVMAFAFQTNDLINNMTFYKQKLINKGLNQLNDTYLGQWVDPDLGFYNDDFVGCDVARGLGICYNGDNDDEGVNGYGTNPPSVGVDFFKGPYADFTKVADGIDNDKDGTTDEPEGEGDGLDNDRDGFVDELEKEAMIGADGNPVLDPSGNPVMVDVPEKIIMSSFIYYNNDNNATNGNPSLATHFYNYLQAVWKDNKIITHGKDGTDQSAPKYNFMFSDDTDPKGYGFATPANPIPNTPPPFDWSESNTQPSGGVSNVPADRRFLQSAGPFTLKPGAVNELTIGVIWAQANSGGAQGSLGLLKYADDKAQKLFDNDFKLPQGPDAPDLAITELDQQLVLTLIPRKFRTSNNDEVTTETYFEIDNSLRNIPGITDPVYRFEGYKVYQLRDLTVQASDVDDLERARLVAQADIRNGVSDIITYEFDADINDVVPRLRVKGSDKGVFHTLNITTDLFATGNDRIVNFKPYHYLVVAYAYNGDPKNTDDKYLEGRKVSISTGIPHKTAPENGGTVLNSGYGSTTEITRIFGTGNGGNVLEITTEDENAIVANNSEALLDYEKGRAPFVVKVYDPKKVQGGEFKVKLSSRVVYRRSTANGAHVQLGDTIQSTGNFNVPDVFDANKFPNKIAGKQVQGIGIVRRIMGDVNKDSLITLDVEMLNDHINGRFTANVDLYETTGVAPNTSTDLKGHSVESRPFKSRNSTFTATAVNYVQNDFWYLIKPNSPGEKIFADRPISEFNEQLIPDYGIAIEFKHANNPGEQILFNALNGFQESTIAYSNSNKWFEGVPVGPNKTQDGKFTGTEPWLLPKSTPTTSSFAEEIDPNYNYLNLLGGSWAPYALTNKSPNGAAYNWTNNQNRILSILQNVDVVITSDKSKWTRVPVLQGAGSTPWFQLTKRSSDVESVNKEGNPDGTNSEAYPNQKSVGMGWFPGYAIDLDRGVRLNMMFAEYGLLNFDANNPAQVAENNRGRDLIWNPTADQATQYGRNYIYVVKTPYDEGRQLGMSLDTAKYAPNIQNNPTALQNYLQKHVFDKVMWVGYPRLAKGAELLQSDVRVRMRVNRYFTSYNPANQYNVTNGNKTTSYKGNFNPEYSFNINALAPQVAQGSAASEALKLVRVVPNPYYAYSGYEQRVLDNIVKFTNLPRRCKITIYSVNGTLVRTFNKDDARTYLDWNLKNESNLAIASGVYVIHVDAGEIGHTVLKWFGIMRPADLESF